MTTLSSSGRLPHLNMARKKKEKRLQATPDQGSLAQYSYAHDEPQFPLASCLWYVRNETSTWITLPPILTALLLFRAALGLWGYSGIHAKHSTSISSV